MDLVRHTQRDLLFPPSHLPPSTVFMHFPSEISAAGIGIIYELKSATKMKGLQLI